MAVGIVGEAFVQLRPYIGDFGTEAGAQIDKAAGTLADRFRKSWGSRLMAGGGLATAAGAALQAAAGPEEQANARLQTAIKNTGHSYDDYGKRIDGAVKQGERFGRTSADTQSALAVLTTGFNDPNKALKYLNETFDLAAAKHQDLATAAGQIVRVYSGTGARTLGQFGINVKNLANNQATLTKAQKEATTSGDQLTKAQQHLSDVQARLGAKTQPASHAAVDTATRNLSQAQQHLADVQRERVAPTAKAVAEHNARLEAAQNRVTNATARLSDAQGKAVATGHLTVAQQIELRDAQDRVTEATKKHNDAEAALATAQKAAKDGSSQGSQALDILAKKLHGTSENEAKTFQGRLETIKARTEDVAASIGHVLSPVLLTAGPLLLGLGALASGLSKAAGGLKSLFSGGFGKQGQDAAAALDGSAGKLQSAQDGLAGAATKLSESATQLSAAAEKLSTAGGTAATEMEGGATAASGTLDASGATVATEIEGGADAAATTLDAAGATVATEIKDGADVASGTLDASGATSGAEAASDAAAAGTGAKLASAGKGLLAFAGPYGVGAAIGLAVGNTKPVQALFPTNETAPGKSSNDPKVLAQQIVKQYHGDVLAALKGLSGDKDPRDAPVIAILRAMAGASLAGSVPGFQWGGIVPGPAGAPRLVMAHGGEEISGLGRHLRGRVEQHFHIHPSAALDEYKVGQVVARRAALALEFA